MSIQNPYDGSVFVTEQHQVGFGSAISTPATRLQTMRDTGVYYEEVSATGAEDVLLVNCENYLVSLYKSFVNQKLLQQFVVRMTSVGGQNKLRFIHRNLATTFTFEQALRAVGVNATVSDDFGGTMTAINQQLAPLYIQVYKA